MAPCLALRQSQGVPSLPKQERRHRGLSVLAVFSWLPWLCASASSCQFLCAPLRLLFEPPLNVSGSWGVQISFYPRDLVTDDS